MGKISAPFKWMRAKNLILIFFIYLFSDVCIPQFPNFLILLIYQIFYWENFFLLSIEFLILLLFIIFFLILDWGCFLLINFWNAWFVMPDHNIIFFCSFYYKVGLALYIDLKYFIIKINDLAPFVRPSFLSYNANKDLFLSAMMYIISYLWFKCSIPIKSWQYQNKIFIYIKFKSYTIYRL